MARYPDWIASAARRFGDDVSPGSLRSRVGAPTSLEKAPSVTGDDALRAARPSPDLAGEPRRTIAREAYEGGLDRRRRRIRRWIAGAVSAVERDRRAGGDDRAATGRRRGASARGGNDPAVGVDRRLAAAEGLQLGAGDLVAGVVAGADERRRLDVLEAERRAPRPSSRRTRRGGSSARAAGASRDGRRYWPIVRMSTSTARSASNASVSSSRVSPSPTISELFVWAA